MIDKFLQIIRAMGICLRVYQANVFLDLLLDWDFEIMADYMYRLDGFDDLPNDIRRFADRVRNAL